MAAIDQSPMCICAPAGSPLLPRHSEGPAASPSAHRLALRPSHLAAAGSSASAVVRLVAPNTAWLRSVSCGSGKSAVRNRAQYASMLLLASYPPSHQPPLQGNPCIRPTKRIPVQNSVAFAGMLKSSQRRVKPLEKMRAILGDSFSAASRVPAQCRPHARQVRDAGGEPSPPESRYGLSDIAAGLIAIAVPLACPRRRPLAGGHRWMVLTRLVQQPRSAHVLCTRLAPCRVDRGFGFVHDPATCLKSSLGRVDCRHEDGLASIGRPAAPEGGDGWIR